MDRSRFALVIQCFVKLDTLTALCASLLECRGHDEIDVLFWCDSPVGNTRAPYAPLQAKVYEFITGFARDQASDFASIEVKVNETNKGTCRTCEIAMTYALERHDHAIFSEDDTTFAADALDWFKASIETEAFRSERVWAVAGESIFFNAQGKAVVDRVKADAIGIVEAENLIDKFIEVTFLPSTCFMTSVAKWKQFASTRGQPLGDMDVNARCQAEGRTCVMPVVPRVRDVGMLHDLGFSVSIHTVAGVNELKNTYLTSDDLKDRRAEPSILPTPFKGQEDALYQRYTLLHGYDAPDIEPAGTASPVAEDLDATVKVTGLEGEAEPRGDLLAKTFALIAGIHPGTYVPKETKCFDADEVDALGRALSRLVYAPAQLRERLERHGASIIPVNSSSPVPSQHDIERSFRDGNQERYGLIFNDESFLRTFLEDLIPFASDFAPPTYEKDGAPPCFVWGNHQFSYSDAMAYYAILRKFKPDTVLEIGGGWSTLVADAALRANGRGRIVTVAPSQPELLSAITSPHLRAGDDVYELGFRFFQDHLAPGDVLHIDCSHAVRHAADTLFLYLEMLPRLQVPVYVHVHDVKLPFSFSIETMRDHQIYWSEQYLLYAYLLDHRRANVLYGSNFHAHHNPKLLDALMHGRCAAGGASLWFQQGP